MSDLTAQQELRIHALEMARQHHTNLGIGAESPTPTAEVVETAKAFHAFLTEEEH